jgi:hypothetical protein
MHISEAKPMKNVILVILLLAFPSLLMAETINGRLDDVYRSGNTITVDGVNYQVNMDATKIYHGRNQIGEEDLSQGDEVTLVFSDEVNEQQQRVLTAIILVRGRKQGLDS